MICPSCGSDNDPSAESCSICSIVLPKAAPAAAPGADKPKLDTGRAISELLVLALKSAQAARFDEAEAIMSRLYAEADPLLCRDVLSACAAEWLKIANLPPEESQSASERLVKIAEAVGENSIKNAAPDAALMTAMVAKVPERTAEGARLQLLLLGIKGAAGGNKGGAPGAAGAEPATLDTPAARKTLFLLAEGLAVAGRMPEAQRLMGRLAKEVAPETIEAMIYEAGDEWLAGAGLPEKKHAQALDLVASAGRAAGAGDLAGAHMFFMVVLPLMKAKDPAGARLTLLALAAKAAANQ